MFRGCQNPTFEEYAEEEDFESPRKSFNSSGISSELKVRRINYRASPYQVFSANNLLYDSKPDRAQLKATSNIMRNVESRTDILDASGMSMNNTEILDGNQNSLIIGEKNYRVYHTGTQYARFSAGNCKSVNSEIEQVITDKPEVDDAQFGSILFDELEQETPKVEDIREIIISTNSSKKTSKSEGPTPAIISKFSPEVCYQTDNLLVEKIIENETVQTETRIENSMNPAPFTSENELEKEEHVELPFIEPKEAVSGPITDSLAIYLDQRKTSSVVDDDFVKQLENKMLEIQRKHSIETTNVTERPVESEAIGKEAAKTEHTAVQIFYRPASTTKSISTNHGIDFQEVSSVRQRIEKIEKQRRERVHDNYDIVDSIVNRKINLLDPERIESPRTELEQLLEDSPIEPAFESNEATSKKLPLTFSIERSPSSVLEHQEALRILNNTPQSEEEEAADSHVSEKMQTIRRRIGASTVETPTQAHALTKSSISAFDLSNPSTSLIMQCTLHCVESIFVHGKYDSYHVRRVSSERKIDYGSVAYFVNALERELVSMIVELSEFVDVLERRITAKLVSLETHYDMIANRVQLLRSGDIIGSDTPIQREFERIQQEYRIVRSDLFSELME